METELYKQVDGDFYYWRAGHRGSKVVVHSGKVGEPGEVREIAVAPGERPETTIVRESGQVRRQGYTELDGNNLAQLVVQYQTEGWGSDEDLDNRDRVDEIVG